MKRLLFVSFIFCNLTCMECVREFLLSFRPQHEIESEEYAQQVFELKIHDGELSSEVFDAEKISERDCLDLVRSYAEAYSSDEYPFDKTFCLHAAYFFGSLGLSRKGEHKGELASILFDLTPQPSRLLLCAGFLREYKILRQLKKDLKSLTSTD